MVKHVHDLLVIGGGPAGAATAFWAASAGLDTVFVEKKTFPRDIIFTRFSICGEMSVCF